MEIMEENRVSFQWKHGDFIVIDNWTVMHARNKSEGTERILTACFE